MIASKKYISKIVLILEKRKSIKNKKRNYKILWIFI